MTDLETYSGRLAFDPDTNFHLAEDGRPVVTEDGGKTWRYAVEGDFSHFERYHERYATVDGTANSANPEPHHFAVLANDPHHDDDNPGNARLRFHPDMKAATVTSHTEAYRD